MSMMVEVARRGKPLAIFELPCQRNLASWLRRLDAGRERRAKTTGGSGRGASRAWDWLQGVGLAGYRRDLSAIHASLYRQRLAVPLGMPFLREGNKAIDELSQVVERIRRELLQG